MIEVPPTDPDAGAPRHAPGQPSPSRFEPPPVGRHVIRRERLLRRLAGSGASHVLMVTAPAGYGKTTLLAQWAGNDPRRVAWLRLEPDDDEPVRLTRNLAFALSSLEPIDPEIFAALRGDASALASVALPQLALDVRGMSPFVLILDEADVLRSAGAQDVLRTIIEHLPDQSLLVIVGRSQPAMQLARLRAGGVLDELAVHELALTTGESLEALEAARPGIPVGLATSIAEQCEGWAAALYLASIAIRHDPNTAMLGADLTIADYLQEEILARISADDRSFLVKSSILDTLAGPMCDAVLDRSDSGPLLRRLADQNLLVLPLDHHGEHFRVHRLFGETLRAELKHSPELPELHLRAAKWFAAHSDGPRAITHALAAGDEHLAAGYVWSITPQLLPEGRSGELARLISRFDPTGRAAHPELDVILGWCATNVGDGEAARMHAERAEAASSGVVVDGTPLIGVIDVLHATVGAQGVAAMGAAAARARETLADESPYRTVALFLEGAARYLNDERDAAKRLAAAERYSTDFVPPLQALCCTQLALIDVEHGDWEAAGRRLRRARAVQRVHGIEEYATQHPVFAVSALVEAQAGEAAAARSEAAQARRLTDRQHDLAPWLLAQTLIVLAQTAVILDDIAAASTLLARAEAPMTLVPDAPALRRHLDETRARIEGHETQTQTGTMHVTTAELRVLQFLPSHHSLGEIADELGVSLNTVKSQVQSAYRKLDASSRSEAVEAARRLGLLRPQA